GQVLWPGDELWIRLDGLLDDFFLAILLHLLFNLRRLGHDDKWIAVGNHHGVGPARPIDVDRADERDRPAVCFEAGTFKHAGRIDAVREDDLVAMAVESLVLRPSRGQRPRSRQGRDGIGARVVEAFFGAGPAWA